MGSDQIGNHVGNTIGYEVEKQKLDGLDAEAVHTTLDWSDKVVPSEVPTEPTQVGGLQQGEEITDPKTIRLFKRLVMEKREQIEEGFGGLNPDPVDVIEFQEFKRQVIKAFKHLGLDTAKHFTE